MKKDFNLQKALEGHPLITRSGIRALNFHERSNNNRLTDYPYQAELEDGTVVTYTRDGTKYSFGSPSATDLHLYIEEESKDYFPPVPGKYKFNAERALDGEIMITRDGRKVESIEERALKESDGFSADQNDYPFIVRLENGSGYTCDNTGRFYSLDEDPKDLFMVNPPTRRKPKISDSETFVSMNKKSVEIKKSKPKLNFDD